MEVLYSFDICLNRDLNVDPSNCSLSYGMNTSTTNSNIEELTLHQKQLISSILISLIRLSSTYENTSYT